jgi:hypothetical protein
MGDATGDGSAHAENVKSLPPFQIVVAYGPAIANKKAGVDAFAAALRENGTRAEVVDASSFREHQSLMTEFGAEGDPVSAEFSASVRGGQAITGLGTERVLKPEGEAAAAATKQLAAYRTHVLMMQFDKNKDGRFTKEDERQSLPVRPHGRERGRQTPDVVGIDAGGPVRCYAGSMASPNDSFADDGRRTAFLSGSRANLPEPCPLRWWFGRSEPVRIIHCPRRK